MNPFAGIRDNHPLETRPDVLTYTSAALPDALDVIGQVSLRLYVHSNRAHTDFYGRLCDVDLAGVSHNVCDGLLRLRPGSGTLQPDGSRCITVDLWATAHRFRRGHRLRLLVASGAHPRWARNLGTGKPPAVGREMVKADQTIYHDVQRPSALLLPIVSN
jgi:putative CocE/NonD family hydrolase